MNAVNWSELTLEELQARKAELEREYAGYVSRDLKLNMSRGKPAGSQLDLTNGILGPLDSHTFANGQDARNYGVLDGIPEAKQLFSELLNIPVSVGLLGSVIGLAAAPWAVIAAAVAAFGFSCKIEIVKKDGTRVAVES